MLWRLERKTDHVEAENRLLLWTSKLQVRKSRKLEPQAVIIEIIVNRLLIRIPNLYQVMAAIKTPCLPSFNTYSSIEAQRIKMSPRTAIICVSILLSSLRFCIGLGHKN